MRARQALQIAIEEISRFSTDQPRRQAEWMIEAILEVDRVKIYSDEHLYLAPVQTTRLKEFLKRLGKGEPLQYILGRADFRNITLKVDRRALIPRPETEGLVDIGLEFVKSVSAPQILDVGTGCGAIALSFLDEHPGAQLTGIDISEEALDLAGENGRSLKLDNRISWIEGDIFAKDFVTQFDTCFDLIVSNPPYVPAEMLWELPVQIRDYEPIVALVCGKDGLDAIRRIAETCGTLLKDDCYLICEIGQNQENSSHQIFQKAGWDARVREDLSGNPRYLVARQA